VLYRVFGRLPRRLRRLIVRVAVPTYTVGSICVVEHDGDVLLVRLAYRKAWGLPGGLLERGEQPAAAAVREVAEETGLAVELLGDPTVQAEPRLRRLDVVFRARPAAGVDPASVCVRSKEIVEVRWWPRADLPPLHHEAAGALRLVRRQPPQP
jgi:ADP-ribose pyrophosphatase YjhB (NUDIX family)